MRPSSAELQNILASVIGRYAAAAKFPVTPVAKWLDRASQLSSTRWTSSMTESVYDHNLEPISKGRSKTVFNFKSHNGTERTRMMKKKL